MSLNDTEAFWAGEFGTEYTARNAGIDWHGRVPFWNKLLQETEEVQSVCELGANCGLNLIALKAIDPALSLTGVEINDEAFQRLTAIPNIRAIHSSVRAFAPAQAFDLVFTSGLLIHLAQEALLETYVQIAGLTRRYCSTYRLLQPGTLRGHLPRARSKTLEEGFWFRVSQIYQTPFPRCELWVSVEADRYGLEQCHVVIVRI
jgi:pseudaminic acid biosynthesis-associated methylase